MTLRLERKNKQKKEEVENKIFAIGNEKKQTKRANQKKCLLCLLHSIHDLRFIGALLKSCWKVLIYRCFVSIPNNCSGMPLYSLQNSDSQKSPFALLLLLHSLPKKKIFLFCFIFMFYFSSFHFHPTIIRSKRYSFPKCGRWRLQLM